MDQAQKLKELYHQKKLIEKEIYRLERLQAQNEKDLLCLWDKIYIDTSKIPRQMVLQLEELAIFDNPQIEILKRLRKPIYNTPYIIKSFESKPNTLMLPRGLMRGVIEIFKQYKIDYSYKDRRYIKTIEVPKLALILRQEQQDAIKALEKKDFSICVAAPGFGKTVIGAKMIEIRSVNTLIIVNKNLLLDQWIERLESYFGMEKKEIGFLGKGKNKLNYHIDVATMQSLKNIPEVIEKYSFAIVDECHHIPALSFESIIKKFRGKYILGLSATPKRKDGMEPLLYQQLGAIAYEQKQKKVGKKEYKTIETEFCSEVDNFGELLGEMIQNESRNQLIIETIKENQRRKILLLSDRIEHIENLEYLLKNEKISFVTIHGSLSKEKQKEEFEKIATSSLVLATTSYFGEGIDFPHLDTIIFATPISYYGRLIQYLGRIGRGGGDCLAIDILDIHNKFALSSFKKRKEGYKQLHYIRSKS